MKKATARAHPNLALVKYWGKRDEGLVLPHQSSLSLTLAPLAVMATVELGTGDDEVMINGVHAAGLERERVLALMRRVQDGRPELKGARVHTAGDFAVAAGLASSAAAFAALAVAARAAAGDPADPRAASILARTGSGSASRSVQGGFCAWHRGDRADGTDSYAEQLFPPSHWPEVRMVVVVVAKEEKEVRSRDGMRHTVATSPFYPAWVEDAEQEMARAVNAIRRRDLEELGAIAERNAWRMHATALSADPPLCYLKPKTLEVIQAIGRLRAQGVPAWFTLDAGPNPVVLTDEKSEPTVTALCRGLGADPVVPCTPGGDAVMVE
ncbi:MAG TPA: diphosphomevalonate decarboxylase [Myxococcaceae bacterium]|nr:diphosphomevalonate decarboxylase [Myxococcaceae bacterium]